MGTAKCGPACLVVWGLGEKNPRLPDYALFIIHPTSKALLNFLYSIYESVDLRGFSFEIEACEKFYHRYIVDIPRIKFFI
jgi:hypothetical protein